MVVPPLQLSFGKSFKPTPLLRPHFPLRYMWVFYIWSSLEADVWQNIIFSRCYIRVYQFLKIYLHFGKKIQWVKMMTSLFFKKLITLFAQKITLIHFTVSCGIGHEINSYWKTSFIVHCLLFCLVSIFQDNLSRY